MVNPTQLADPIETRSGQPTILVATELTERSLALMSHEGSAVQVVSPTLQNVRDGLKTADALIIRDDVPVDAQLLENAPRLKVIARVGANLSGIEIEAATNRGIIVMNTPGASAIAAGEHTLGLMLALSRRLVTAHNSLRDGYWLLDRKRQVGTQLHGKTLGLVGLGRVGQTVAHRALSFGMSVLAFDPYIAEDQVSDSRVVLVSLRELLRKSDFVSIHVPATGETRGLFNADILGQMKKGARLINTSHGSVVDEDALTAALKEGALAGAAVDVYRDEPPYNSPLIGLENVVHTPHIGDNTVEAAQDLSMQITKQVLDALNGTDYRNVVNLPFVAGLDYESTLPYMLLAERMGKLLHALARNPVRRVAVEYRSPEPVSLVKPLTVALLKGLLAPVLGDHINYVNAPVIAAERGIQVTQAKGLPSADYANLLLCQITLEDGEVITIAGTLLDGREPHVVQINDYRMNLIPQGHLLIIGSYDQPGVIGKVGTLLATNGINIGSWQTGRATRGGQTLTVLSLDEPLPEPVMTALTEQEFVRHAHQLEI